MRANRLKSPTSISLACIALTTVFAVSVGPIINALRLSLNVEVIQYAAIYVMLGAYLALMLSLLYERLSRPADVAIEQLEGKLTITPCRVENVIQGGQDFIDRNTPQRFTSLPSNKTRSCRILILNGVSIPREIADLWPLLPNLKILDVQNSILPDEFWVGLERCPELDHVLASGATFETTMKEITMAIPEVRVHQSPTTIVARS